MPGTLEGMGQSGIANRFGKRKGQGGAKASGDAEGGRRNCRRGDGEQRQEQDEGSGAGERGKPRSVRRWTRAGGPTRGPVHSGAGMSLGASSVGADFVEGTVEVSQPVGDDGVGITEDMTPEVEGE